MTRHLRLRLGASLLLVLLCAAGCPVQDLIPPDMPPEARAALDRLLDRLPLPVPDLPAELAVVYADPERFAAGSAGLPLGLAPGAGLDDPAELAGCWGFYRPPGDGIPVFIYAALHLDGASGRFGESFLQQDPLGLHLFSVLTVQEGTFSAAATDYGVELKLVTTGMFSNDPWSGELVPDRLPRGEPWTQVVLLALEGDTLYEWDADSGPVPEDGSWWVYRRFDCP